MAAVHTPPVQTLIDELGRLPGIGPKSAQRIAFHLLKIPEVDAYRLADAIREAKARVQFCERCFNVAESSLCPICTDERRDGTTLCVVEESRDIIAIERTGEFKGRYHVLLGAMNPLEGIGPDQLKIRELNRTTGRSAGIYPEIKSPSFHHQNGQDIATATLKVLKDYGYTQNDGSVYLQSFDPSELKRVNNELMPQMNMDLPLVQLIARTNWKLTQEQLPNGQWANYDYDWMLAPGGMQVIAQYADGVGPHLGMLVDSKDGKLEPNDLVRQAQAQGLVVHPYTVRADALPRGVASIDELHDLLFKQAGVNGVFTDFPDQTIQYLGR